MNRFPLWLLTAFLLASCTSGPAVSATGVDESVPLAVFPSDLYTVADPLTHTGLRVRLPAAVNDDPLFAAMPDLGDEIESLDGFGTSASLWVRFEGPLDTNGLPTPAESLADDSAIRLQREDTGESVSVEWNYDGPTHTLFIAPHGVLDGATRYVLTLSSLRDIEGRPLRKASSRWSQGAGGTSSAAILTTSFTTQSSSETLGLLAAKPVEHTAAEAPVTVSTCGGSPHIGWVGKGLLRSPDYRTDDHRFPVGLDDRVPVGEPAEASIPYLLVLPKSAQRAPLVIVQHGLSGNKEGVLLCTMGNLYAGWGFATAAIDAAWHGERGPGGEKPSPLSYIRVLFGVWMTEDRFTSKFRYGRDAFRQTSLDHTALAALVKTLAPVFDKVKADGSAGADGVADLSGEIFYHGESMGGIIGSLTMASTPHIKTGVLNVPGGRLSNFVVLSKLGLYELVARPLLEANAHITSADARRFLALFQTAIERGDPINYGHRWWVKPYASTLGKNVLIQETIEDVLVPNRTTEDLATAGRLPLLTPALAAIDGFPAVEIPAAGLRGNLAGGLTGGMVQLKTIHREGVAEQAEHGTMGSPEAIDQAAQFYRTATPTVFRVYP